MFLMDPYQIIATFVAILKGTKQKKNIGAKNISFYENLRTEMRPALKEKVL